ncbi:MAG: hypothetical protein ACR2FU_22155, partial [Streptosporangiaceae bacterium]
MSTATVPAGSGTAQAPATSRRRLLAAGLLLPAAALAVTGAGFSAAGPVPGPDAVGLSLAVTWADLLTAAAAVAGALVVVLWLHLLLAVPDGRLRTTLRRGAAAAGYLIALAAAAVVIAAGRPLPAAA